MGIKRLGQTVQRLLDHSIATSTRRSYQSSQKRYTSFCLSNNLPSFPSSQSTLCLYVAYLFEQGLAHTSIKCYLSSVRHLQISKGFPDPFSADLPQLHLLIRGAKVCRGLQGRNIPTRKLPITPTILRQLLKLWLPNKQSYHYILLWAICCTCFFGFFRSGELMPPTAISFDPATHLCFTDLSVDKPISPSLIQFNLKSSKTDPFRKGVQVVVGKTGDELCPVVAMLAYLAVRGGSPGPLFRTENLHPFPRNQFVKNIKLALSQLGLDSNNYAGHSFRAGAATTAAAVGIEDSLIKTLGRWESSAYQQYVRIPKQSLSGVSKSLSRRPARPIQSPTLRRPF